MPEQTGGNRINVWALVVGGVGMVVAIVALVLALTAQHSTNDDAKIAKAVRTEESRQIGTVRADLQKNVTEATDVLRRLSGSANRARRADAALRRDARATRTGVESNRANIAAAQGDIAKLQTSVNGLNAKLKDLTTSVAQQGRAQKALVQRVNTLAQKVNSK